MNKQFCVRKELKLYCLHNKVIDALQSSSNIYCNKYYYGNEYNIQYPCTHI